MPTAWGSCDHLGRQVAGLHGVVAALLAAIVIEQGLQQRLAAHEAGPQLAVAARQPVGLLHGQRGAADRRLLAETRREGPQPPLALQLEHALIRRPGQGHGAVQRHQVLLRDVGLQVAVGDAALVEHLHV